jgi:pimeloyl-ACP methyl ester carboxylesterase
MANLLLSQKLLMNPITGRVLASLSTRSYFHHNFRKLWAKPESYSREEIDQLWELLIMNGGRIVLPKITTYIKQRYTHFDQWVNDGLYKCRIPINLFWADKDPVAIIDMAHVLHENIKNSQLTILKDVGHYPMLEAPEDWADCILKMLNRTE